MGQGAGAVVVAGPDVARVIVGQNDAVVSSAHPTVHRTWVEAVPRRSVGVFNHPHVEVAVARPLNQVLHIAVTDVRQRGHDAVDARVAIAIWIDLGQSEFDFRVRCDILKFDNDICRVRIEFAEVAVHHLNAAVNLLIADVFGAIVVNDVEDNGDDDQFIAVEVFEGLGLLFEPLICLFCSLPCPRMGIEKRLFHHPLTAVADVRGRRSVLGGSHRSCKQQGSRCQQGQTKGSIQHGFNSWVCKIPLFRGDFGKHV